MKGLRLSHPAPSSPAMLGVRSISKSLLSPHVLCEQQSVVTTSCRQFWDSGLSTSICPLNMGTSVGHVWDMGLEFVRARHTENPASKEDGKLLSGFESNFLTDWKAKTKRCKNRPGKVLQDSTCEMLLVRLWRVFGHWGENGNYRGRKSGECVLMFAAEDNGGKHFHFKGIVYWKSESDLTGEAGL